MLISLVSYNPLAATSEDRRIDITSELGNFQVIALQGTQRRARQGEEAVVCSSTANRIWIEAGWKPAPGTNRSAGCALVLRRPFRRSHVRHTWACPIPGRGVAAHVKGWHRDLLLICLYFPVCPVSALQFPAYAATVGKMVQWTESLLSGCGRACTPIIMTDLNDGMGIERVGPAWEEIDTDAVAPAGRRQERKVEGAGHAFRILLERHFLYAANTVGSADHTWYGVHSSSLVDYICLPVGLKDSVQSVGVLRRAARRLQIIPDQRHRDHLPVALSLAYERFFPNSELHIRWDFDALLEEARRGGRRPQVLEAMDRAILASAPLLRSRMLDLQAEIEECWMHRKLADLHRLCLAASGSKIGPKKRLYNAAPSAMPSSEEWLGVWALDGKDGGMQAQQVVWEAHRTAHISSFGPPPPFNNAHFHDAEKDLLGISKYVRRAPKRRATPHHSCPLELLCILLHPNRGIDSRGFGVGFAAQGGPAVHSARQWLLRGLAHIRRTGATPLIWHRSAGVALKKGTAEGPRGKRVVHVLDPLGKGFFASLVARKDPAPPSHMDHGFLRGRRKEGALLVQMCAAWRTRQQGRNFVMNNHDISNAFASSSWQALDRANASITNPIDASLGMQRYRWATISLPTGDSAQLLVKNHCGGSMGDPYIVHSFCRAFHPPVQRWLDGCQHYDPFALCLVTRCPVTGCITDLSLTKYADDLVRIVSSIEGAAGLADASQQSNAALDA